MNNFTIKNSVSYQDVLNMQVLDKLVFKEANQVSVSVIKSWYEKNPDIYTGIFNKNELIGYINFMPITDDCYNKYITGKYGEENISKDDILIMQPNGSYYTLFSSIVISPKYQKTSAFTKLIFSFYKSMKKFIEDNNITIKSTIAECVNKNMENFVKNNNFKKIKSKIYEGNIF